MKTFVLKLAAVAEILTGLIAVVSPSVAVKLLFDAQVLGAGTNICRVLGISLIGLSVACWPGNSATERDLYGMLSYSTLTALYLAYVGISGRETGVLLWPAVAVHIVLSVLLLNAWRQGRTTRGSPKRALDKSPQGSEPQS